VTRLIGLNPFNSQSTPTAAQGHEKLHGRRGVKNRVGTHQCLFSKSTDRVTKAKNFISVRYCAGVALVLAETASVEESPTAVAFEALALHDCLQMWPQGGGDSSSSSSSSSSSAPPPRVPSALLKK